MCKRIQCERCQKVGFSGCGKHLDQVFRGVTEAERCRCHEAVALYPRGSVVAALQALQAGAVQVG